MKALALRTCNEDMISHKGFKWPESGYVECPDWSEEPYCGNGLHGLLWGEGDWYQLDWDQSARWLVVEIDKWVDLDGKVKFPNGNVVHVGNQKSATDYIYNNGGQGKAIVGLSVAIGSGGEATVGTSGVAAVGLGGVAKVEGEFGIAIVGDCGTAKVGNFGMAAVGDRGSVNVGNNSMAIVGHGGKAKAGLCGIIQIGYYDKSRGRRRIVTGYVGEDGIEPNVFYKLENGKLVKAE